MSVSPERVIVVGAGPVGLALSLKLAQNGVAVTLLESLTAANFLDQVPRAGSNHPVTLEMYADIGLYDRLLARGLVAPKFQYWDREHDEMFAEFDHAVIAADTRFPFVLQCERIKIIEEALAFAHEHDLIDIRMGTTFVDFTQDNEWVDAVVDNAAGERETIRARYVVSAEGARSVVRKALDIEFEGFTYPEQTLNIVTAYDFKQHGFADRNYISDPGEYVNLFHWPGRRKCGASTFPPIRIRPRANCSATSIAKNSCASFCRRAARTTSCIAISIPCISAWPPHTARDGRFWRAIRRT